MREALLRELNGIRTLSIVGMCKNAGKTTVLNWLLSHAAPGRVLGLTSIGRDGESVDVVTGTDKPGIFVPEGTLIATAKDMLALSDVTMEIVHTTGIPTPPPMPILYSPHSMAWDTVAMACRPEEQKRLMV